jgi:hypothetical protein
LLLILALLPALFFWRLLAPNPADRMSIAAGDFTAQYYPLRAFTAQEWTQGRIPLWNPYLYGGQPALADIQAGALYPPHVVPAMILGWLGLGFPLWALELQVLAHFSLAATGTFLCARHLLNTLTPRPPLPKGEGGGDSPHPGDGSLRRARFGGVIAALVFTYGGYLTGFPVQQLTILEVSAWLPWVLWGVAAAQERLTTGRPTGAWLGAAGWGAFAFAFAILAGHPQTVLYIFYLSLAYTLFDAYRCRSFGLLRPWLVVVGLGGAMAAAQLWPTLEFIAYSLRADLSYEAVSAGLPLNELVAVLYPGFFGGSPEYVGWAGLALIGAAMAVGQPRRMILFWAGAMGVGLLLAFGGNTFLYPLFYLLVPGFAAVRQQERALLVYSFSAAILAGYGASGPLPVRVRAGLRVVAVALLGLTGFFLYGSAAATARGDEVNLFVGVLRHHLFGLIILGGMLIFFSRRRRRRLWSMTLLAAWVAFELFTVNWRFNLEQSPAPFTPDPATQFLQSALTAEPGRVASGGLLPGGNSAASVYRLPDLTGNTPLQLAATARFLARLPAWRAWQLMNVRYVVERRNIADAGLTLAFGDTGDDDSLKVFAMGDPFPRARFVAEVEVIPTDEEALARLAAADFDLRRAVVVPAPLALPPPIGEALVTVAEASPTELNATVETLTRRLLLFSQVYYPGWRAELDGQPAELLRVNVIQQGVVVPPGRHAVRLAFRPTSFWGGAVISAVGVLLGLALIGYSNQNRSQL